MDAPRLFYAAGIGRRAGRRLLLPLIRLAVAVADQHEGEHEAEGGEARADAECRLEALSERLGQVGRVTVRGR